MLSLHETFVANHILDMNLGSIPLHHIALIPRCYWFEHCNVMDFLAGEKRFSMMYVVHDVDISQDWFGNNI